jgi:hypothetical protein
MLNNVSLTFWELELVKFYCTTFPEYPDTAPLSLCNLPGICPYCFSFTAQLSQNTPPPNCHSFTVQLSQNTPPLLQFHCPAYTEYRSITVSVCCLPGILLQYFRFTVLLTRNTPQLVKFHRATYPEYPSVGSVILYNFPRILLGSRKGRAQLLGSNSSGGGG